MKKTSFVLTLLSGFLCQDSPIPPTPIGCEYLCFNTNLIGYIDGQELIEGQHIDAYSTVNLFLKLGSENKLVLFCCDNFYVEYELWLPNGTIIENSFHGLWGFASYFGDENASVLYLPLGEFQVTPQENIYGCAVPFYINTIQISTGSPWYEFPMSDSDVFFLDNPDINEDYVVNSADIIEVVSDWGGDDKDTNCDGLVNIEDLVMVLNHWGTTF